MQGKDRNHLVDICVIKRIIGDKYNPFFITRKAEKLLPANRQPIKVLCLKPIMLLCHTIFQCQDLKVVLPAGKIKINIPRRRSSQDGEMKAITYRSEMAGKFPLAGLIDRYIITKEKRRSVGRHQYNGIREPIFTNSPYSPAAIEAGNGVVMEYGRNSQERDDPYIIVFVQVKLQDIIVGQPVFLGIIPERPAVEPAHPLVGGKPYKAVPVLQGMIYNGARQPVFHRELSVRQFLAVAANGDKNQRYQGQAMHAKGALFV
jgi:hypothetical protein